MPERMWTFLADENYREQVLIGTALRVPEFDVVTIEQLRQRSVADSAVLDLAAELGRVVLTHDRKTLVPEAYRRIPSGLMLPAVVFSHWESPIGPTIESVVTLCLASVREEQTQHVITIPF